MSEEWEFPDGFEVFSEDPRPDCKHEWESIGTTTICSPPIRHYACWGCRMFKEETLLTPYHDGGDVRYTNAWVLGPWDWDHPSSWVSYLREQDA